MTSISISRPREIDDVDEDKQKNVHQKLEGGWYGFKIACDFGACNNVFDLFWGDICVSSLKGGEQVHLLVQS